MNLTYYKVRISLKAPFTTSFGTQIDREAYIFHLKDEGINAYSESVSDAAPFYSYEDNDTVFHIIKSYLIDMIKDLPSPQEFLNRANRIKGHNMAKAAMEMLLWDYHAKKEGKSIAEALGRSKGYAEVGISIGISSPENMIKSVEDAIKRGYKRIKVKIEKGKEIAILSSIRDVFPEIPLTADANSDYTLKDLHILKKLDKFNLLYIEQPLAWDDIIDHAKLRKNISTPICLDESITSSDKARKAFELNACEVINIKPGRVAGLTESLAIAKIARENKGHAWVGGMLETGIGRAFNIALASYHLIDYPGDTSPNDKYFERDIVKNPFIMNRGMIKPNKGLGIGVDVDFDHLKKFAVESGRLI